MIIFEEILLYTDIRLKMAAVMPSNSTTPVTSIATEVGFNTISSFNRQFKRGSIYHPANYVFIGYQEYNKNRLTRISLMRDCSRI